MDLVYSLFTKKQKWDFGLILFFDNNDPVGSIRFFETQLLHNLSVSKNLSLVTDHDGFRQIVSNPSNARYAGVHYNIERVKLKNFGVFHPKLYLFVSQNELLILMGSFNLTNSGFKRNFESVIRVHFSLESLNPGDRDFILEVRDFLQNTFVSSNDLIEPVANSLKRTVDDLIRSPFFRSVDEATEADVDIERKFFFISSLNNSLINQLHDKIGNYFEKIQILSPFYDKTLDAFRAITPTADIVEVYVPSEKSTFPKVAFLEDTDLANEFAFFKVKKEESKINRFIHAKFYSFLRGKLRWDFITSSNFSSSGLFRGPDAENSKPRNLEIGVLIQNDIDSESLPLSKLHIKELRDFNDITCDTDTKGKYPDRPSFDEEIGKRLLIESAYYDNEKIIFRLFENQITKDFSASSFKAHLIFGQANGGEYTLQKNGEEFYFVPNLEIEGDKRIQFSLVSKEADFVSIPANVNRLRHEPNYFPALGASAFHECLKIGGEAGIAKAFTIAQNSGKEDWLLYLLTHWPLERILEGLTKGNPAEENPNETEDLVPTLRKKNIPDYRQNVLRKNVSTLLGSTSTYGNLKKFLEKFDELTDNNPQKVVKYNKYCFPLFLEISFRFYKILRREEEKKKSCQPSSTRSTLG